MDKTRFIGIVLILLSFTNMSCIASYPGYEASKPGTYKHKMNTRVNGFLRSYLIHIPNNYDPDKPTPLVVVLHGAYSTAKKMERETGFSELADKEGFIVLYPNGITFFGWLQHWNAQHCCGKAMKDGIDDIAFITSVIEQAKASLNVDPNRIYMVGYSNGGMLAYLFASEMSEALAAVAIIASSIGSKPSSLEPERRIPEPKGPVPMIIFHGREDDTIPYNGGQQVKKKGHDYVSVDESVHFWVQNNKCTEPVIVENLLDGKVMKQEWIRCKNGSELILITIDGWKHDLPSHYFTDQLPSNNPLKSFHAMDMIWEFFKSHQL